METEEMIAFLKALRNNFYSNGEHLELSISDADALFSIALRMETLHENAPKKLKQCKSHWWGDWQ